MASSDVKKFVCNKDERLKPWAAPKVTQLTDKMVESGATNFNENTSGNGMLELGS